MDRQTRSLGPPSEKHSLRALAYLSGGLVVGALPIFYHYLRPRFPEVSDPVFSLVGTSLLIPVIVGGSWLIIRGYRALQPSADRLRAHDSRPPVLLLRSFRDDTVKLPQCIRYWPLPSNQRSVRLELVVGNRLGIAGPLIAIGDPREGLPQFGAARAYLDDAGWQAQVIAWMRVARIIAVIAGSTEWVRWEMQQLLDANLTGKLIIFLPPVTASERQVRWANMLVPFAGTQWFTELRRLDITNVVALRLMDNGNVSTIESPTRTTSDYDLASFMTLYQMAPAILRSEAANVAPADAKALLRGSLPATGGRRTLWVAVGVLSAWRGPSPAS